MNIGLITIGNELLSGFTVNTNASWLGQQLLQKGILVTWHVTIGDQKDTIRMALDRVPENVSVVIITGGLGPTHDDVTFKTLLEYFDTEPVFDEDYWQKLIQRMARRGLGLPEINRNQALRPKKGSVLPNNVGSARGLHLSNERLDVFALPGVPREMKSMFQRAVLPKLTQQVPTSLHVKTIRTTGIMESALAEKLKGVLPPDSLVQMAYLPEFIGVNIRLVSHDKVALEHLSRKIEEKARKYIYGYDDTMLETVVGQLLKEQKRTVATAESCTGGLLSHRLTNVPGSSVYMMGGIIAYSNAVKMSSLKVKETTLTQHGAVSEETATEMAQGVRTLLSTDFGVSITGIAGPTGGTETKPVGLVYIGLADGENTWVRKFHFVKDRTLNKRLSSQAALNMLRLRLMNLV
jgi:nicotinamide-nucleotide amidase